MTVDKKQGFENCKAFLRAIDTGKGYDAGIEYVKEGGAAFDCQCEALKDMTTVKEYADWLEGLGKGPLPGNTVEVKSIAFDEEQNLVTYVGVFTATHSGEGGPVPPTNKEMKSDYVYLIQMNDDGKVESMKKIWNDGFALKQVGWA
ncbi:MAG: hypothetical protein SGARI_005736 [Bacillariaceae sp.]